MKEEEEKKKEDARYASRSLCFSLHGLWPLHGVCTSSACVVTLLCDHSPYFPMSHVQDCHVSKVILYSLMVLVLAFALKEMGGGDASMYTRFLEAIARLDGYNREHVFPSFGSNFKVEVVVATDVTTSANPVSDVRSVGTMVEHSAAIVGRVDALNDGLDHFNASLAGRDVINLVSSSGDSVSVGMDVDDVVGDGSVGKGAPSGSRVVDVAEGDDVEESDTFRSSSNPYGYGIGRFDLMDAEDPELGRAIEDRRDEPVEVMGEVNLVGESSSNASLGALPFHSGDDSVGSLVDFLSEDPEDPVVAMISIDERWTPRDHQRHLRKGERNYEESQNREERINRHKTKLDAQREKHKFVVEVLNNEVSMPQTTESSSVSILPSDSVQSASTSASGDVVMAEGGPAAISPSDDDGPSYDDEVSDDDMSSDEFHDM